MCKKIAELMEENVKLKEALARVEAEKHTIECRFEVSEDTLSCIRGCLRAAEGDIDQLKAHMAEAVGLLKELRATIPKDVLSLWCIDRDDLLARHAQAGEGEDHA